MISAKLLNDYRRALTSIVEDAHSYLSQTFTGLISGGVSEQQLRDGMIEAAWGATSDLGNLSSVVAADFYEKVRETDIPGDPTFQAWLAELPDLSEIEKQGHMSARFLFDREGPGGRVYKAAPDMFFRELTTNIERMIIDAARDTIVASGERDSEEPLVAVLARPGACDYCMRAMNEGWKVPSRAARSGGIFHDHCRCITAPSWEKRPTVEGVVNMRVEPQYDLNPF